MTDRHRSPEREEEINALFHRDFQRTGWLEIGAALAVMLVQWYFGIRLRE